MPIYTVIEKIDKSMLEAAADLGAAWDEVVDQSFTWRGQYRLVAEEIRVSAHDLRLTVASDRRLHQAVFGRREHVIECVHDQTEQGQ